MRWRGRHLTEMGAPQGPTTVRGTGPAAAAGGDKEAAGLFREIARDEAGHLRTFADLRGLQRWCRSAASARIGAHVGSVARVPARAPARSVRGFDWKPCFSLGGQPRQNWASPPRAHGTVANQSAHPVSPPTEASRASLIRPARTIGGSQLFFKRRG